MFLLAFSVIYYNSPSDKLYINYLKWFFIILKIEKYDFL
jgi:hypothetical protein